MEDDYDSELEGYNGKIAPDEPMIGPVPPGPTIAAKQASVVSMAEDAASLVTVCLKLLKPKLSYVFNSRICLEYIFKVGDDFLLKCMFKK
jgi:hypothetical protein